MQKGKFVISLDFEIYWGVRDKKTIEAYRTELLGVRMVIPRLLDLFEKYRIQATFATVGLLFFGNKQDMQAALPELRPAYVDKGLSPYPGIESAVRNSEQEDPYHFGLSLIDKIREYNQEIGSHTFCHYYCLEEGQTKEEFMADLCRAIEVASGTGDQLLSFVFPRNQYNAEYLDILKENGLIAYRGNESAFIFNPAFKSLKLKFARALRLLDTYMNISGHNIYNQETLLQDGLVNIPASRFLRPYSTKLKSLERIRLKRITSSMTKAAQAGKVYHLWWHPHNFGSNSDKNFAFLEKILQHYKKLNEQYGFESRSMGNLAKEVMES